MSYTTTSLDGVLATDTIENAQQVIDAIASQGSITTGTVSVSSSVNTDKITISGDTINSIGATTNDIKLTNSVSGLIKIDNILTLKNNTIGSLTNNDVVIAPSGSGSLKTDNLQFNGNTVSVTDTNGNLNLNPDGTGKVIIDNDLAIDRNGITQNASSDINLTNNTGSVKIDNILTLKGNTIGSLSNNDIIITPNGSGTVKTDNLQFDGNTISATDTNGSLILQPNGIGTVRTDNLQFDGNTVSVTDTNGNLILQPNGTGTVRTDNLQFDGNTVSVTNTNGNLNLNPDGTGKIIIDNDLAIDRNGITQNASGDIKITNNTGSLKIDNILTLKGNTIGSVGNNHVVISPNGSGALRTDNLQFDGNTISATDTNGNLILQPNGTGTVRTDNLQFDGNTVSVTDTDGSLILQPNGTGTVKTDNLQFDGNTISTTNTNGNLILQPNGTGKVTTDNLSFDGNTISSTNTNGDIFLQTNGTGKVTTDNLAFQANTISSINPDGDIVLQPNGAGKVIIDNDLAIDGNGITQNASGDINITNNTGSVKIDNILTLKGNTIGSLTNNDIIITPNGSGTVKTDNLQFDGNTISATDTNGNLILQPNGTGTVKTDNLQFDGNTISATDTNGSLILQPNGIGTVRTDNLQFDGNTISTTNTNGSLILQPNGTGTVKTDNLQFDGNTVSVTNTNGSLILQPNGAGNVALGNMTFNSGQVIGASQDDYVLKYDYASNTISLEQDATGASSPWTTVGSDITYNTGNVKVSNLTLSSEEITQSAGSDLRLTTTAKVRVDNLSLDAGTLKAETGNLTLTCDDNTKKVFIGTLPFKIDQTVGSGQDGYVLTYDNSTAKILLEPLTSTSNWTNSSLDIYRLSKVGVGVNSSSVNSQLMVKDTSASHCAIQVIGGQSQNCSLKLSRGTGTWSASGNETVGLHLDTDSLFISKLTGVGNNLDGYSGDTMRVDVQNSKVGIASYPYAPTTTLQIGSIASGRTESVRCSTNQGAGTADRSIQMGVDATSSFFESNNSTNGPIELQIRQGTNGNVFKIDNQGDVGINQSNPNAKLHVTGSNGKYALQVSGDSGSSDAQVVMTGSTYGLAMSMNNNSGSHYAISVSSSTQNIFYLKNNGFMGLGTTSPNAPLQVFNANAGVGLVNGYRQYFDYLSGPNKDVSAGWTFNDVSIYALGDIVGNGYILSHASTTFSDRRIKDNIVDLEDDQCLQKLRLIKPKTYTYRDIAKRGTAPVYGFIAQEVKEVLDYAVSTIDKEIPNIYKRATVSPDRKTLIFAEPIVFENEHKRVILKTHHNKDVEVLVVSHTPTSLTLEEEIEQDDISVENQVFVYGQIIPDFHHLKKDAIFTVAVSALQEVDRVQQLHKNKISTLEARMSILEQRLNNAGL